MADPRAVGCGDLVAVARNAAVDHLESHQPAGHALGLLLLQQGAVDELLALGEFGDPAQSAFERRGGVVDVVAVEAEALLQTQRIARAQTDILESELFAGLPERFPEFVAVFVGRVNLAAARSGIARDRKDGVAACDLHLFEGVVLHLLDRLVAHLLHDLHGQRSLHGELADFVRSVVKLLAVAHLHAEGLSLGADMLPVLVDIGGVDAEHVGFGVDAVNQDVVDDAPAAVGHAGVLHLAVEELRNVVGRDALQQIERPGTLDPDFAHVAHVEDPGAVAHGHVLVVDAREFDGHVVSREFGHLGARGDVVLGEYGGFHM